MTSRRIRIGIFAILAAWAATAVWIVPALIRWVHGGGGPSFLRGVIAGSDRVPLARYLATWGQVAPKITFVLATTAIIAWFFLPILGTPQEKAGTPEADAARAPLPLRTAVFISLWFGLVLGLGEAWYLGWKRFVVLEVVPNFRYVSGDSLWMAPLMDVIVMLVLGLLAWYLARLIRRPLTLRWLVGILALAGLLCLIMINGRLVAYAAVILALGAAVRLAAMAGTRARRFTHHVTRSVPWLAAAVAVIALVVTAVPRLAERSATAKLPRAAGGTPNVIVIVMDTERAPSMGLYGYQRPTTPNLARFASRGAVFDRAIAPSYWTLPSHASMFTSRYPHELSTTFVTGLDDRWPTLAEVLRDHGYMTAGFVANVFFCTRLFGLDRGFLHYEAQPVSLTMATKSAWLTREMSRGFRGDEDESTVRKDAARITRDFLAWQAEQPAARPYLAFLNYFDAHGPYNSPPEYRKMYLTGPAPVNRGKKAELYQPSEIQGFKDVYDGAITYLDAQLGVLFTELERRGQLDRTVVIVTSDHGEDLGEHGYIGHSVGIGMPLIHVPLMVLNPAVPAGRIERAVSMRDLPATVMEMTGIRNHPFNGRSWSRHWSPAVPGDTLPEPVYSEYMGSRSVMIGDWRYAQAGRQYLFNVADDPMEQRNLMGTADTVRLAVLRPALERLKRGEVR